MGLGVRIYGCILSIAALAEGLSRINLEQSIQESLVTCCPSVPEVFTGMNLEQDHDGWKSWERTRLGKNVNKQRKTRDLTCLSASDLLAGLA